MLEKEGNNTMSENLRKIVMEDPEVYRMLRSSLISTIWLARILRHKFVSLSPIPTESEIEIAEVRQLGSPIIDIGCGSGWLILRGLELGKDVIGIDVSKGNLKLAKALLRGKGLSPPSHTRLGYALTI
jgi:2-polyprenyl-3-methyl-5-hydroxy-6-metoxy-1,4-benzoquinol methylase